LISTISIWSRAISLRASGRDSQCKPLIKGEDMKYCLRIMLQNLAFLFIYGSTIEGALSNLSIQLLVDLLLAEFVGE
jgi:hypothetical protein